MTARHPFGISFSSFFPWWWWWWWFGKWIWKFKWSLSPLPISPQPRKQKRKSKETSKPKLAFFSCSCTLNSCNWLEENERERPRVRGRNGKLEKGKRRVCERSWYVAHDIWESKKKNISTRKKDWEVINCAVKIGLYIYIYIYRSGWFCLRFAQTIHTKRLFKRQKQLELQRVHILGRSFFSPRWFAV